MLSFILVGEVLCDYKQGLHKLAVFVFVVLVTMPQHDYMLPY